MLEYDKIDLAEGIDAKQSDENSMSFLLFPG